MPPSKIDSQLRLANPTKATKDVHRSPLSIALGERVLISEKRALKLGQFGWSVYEFLHDRHAFKAEWDVVRVGIYTRISYANSTHCSATALNTYYVFEQVQALLPRPSSS